MTFTPSPHLIISCGTSPAASLREMIRDVENLKNSLRRDHASTKEYRYLQQLRDLETKISFLALDIDFTNVYSSNIPLKDPVPEWPVDKFMLVKLPGPYTREQIQKGYFPKGTFDLVNPLALQTIEGDANASGGTPLMLLQPLPNIEMP